MWHTITASDVAACLCHKTFLLKDFKDRSNLNPSLGQGSIIEYSVERKNRHQKGNTVCYSFHLSSWWWAQCDPVMLCICAEIAYWMHVAITAHAGRRWSWNWKMAIMLSWENPFEFVDSGAATECLEKRVAFTRLYSMVHPLWVRQWIIFTFTHFIILFSVTSS